MNEYFSKFVAHRQKRNFLIFQGFSGPKNIFLDIVGSMTFKNTQQKNDILVYGVII